MNKHDELIKKCELLLYSITDKEVVIPLKDFKLYMGIKHYKEECIEKIFELLDRETPKKPTKNDKTNHDWNSRFCPNCGRSLLFKGAGCINNNCRQKIDWSNEE